MYKQTLYKILPNHVKSKILKRNNRYKKWEYGYNEDHDFVVISRTGMIGEVYEIQGLKIALPKQPKNIHKFESERWEKTLLPKVLGNIQKILKKDGMIILTKSLIEENRVFGIIIKVSLLILLVLTICTCSGVRLMLGHQTLEKPIDYSSYSGKLAKQTSDAMECVTLKTVDQDSLLWPQGRL